MIETLPNSLLVDAAPSPGGDLLLTDTGQARPLVKRLVVAQRFGRQGTLHLSHTVRCQEYKRWHR